MNQNDYIFKHKIIPIFNQNSRIWGTFADLHFAGKNAPKAARNEYIAHCNELWKSPYLDNFAYMVYMNAEPVGFINGVINSDMGGDDGAVCINAPAFVDDVCVSDKHRDTIEEIPYFLIKNADYALRTQTRIMSFAPDICDFLPSKARFKLKLSNVGRLTMCDLYDGRAGSVPLFKTTMKVLNECRAFMGKDDIAKFKHHLDVLHKPTYIQYGYNNEVVGILLGDTVNGTGVVKKYYYMPSLVDGMLEKTFKHYTERLKLCEQNQYAINVKNRER